ncbi:MAG: flagellar biosynthesis protein FliQ [Thermotogaceae bacterium]|jgi:flagellar biosynthetic protein FliQ|nr:flagellar biosynthesis protein FliQ [Thermotogaceae bacterium]MDN5337429.1 flagellar biosynthesis protein FliQ [Thermotogaceae bacterium]
MTVETFLDAMNEGITVFLMVIAPVLLISLLVGLIISIFQTVTQINEQTVTFVSKIFAVFISLLFLGGWMLQKLVDYFYSILSSYFNMI